MFDTLNSSKIKFDGIDGKFYFKKNMIERDLDILEIKNGLAKKLVINKIYELINCYGSVTYSIFFKTLISPKVFL